MTDKIKTRAEAKAASVEKWHKINSTIIGLQDEADVCCGFVKREYKELLEALEKLERTRCKRRLMLAKRQDISDAIKALMWEVADVSNTLDYLFEGLLMDYTGLEDEIE